MPRRRLTSVAMRSAGSVYLFDCGEGTQVPYKELHLGQRALALVAVTHLHADHCLGLPGMLMLRAQMPDPGPLAIVGPPGLRRFVTNVRADLSMYINYSIEVTEWSEGSRVAFQDEAVRVLWAPLDHSVLCLGYRLEELPRPGRFDAGRAEALGVPFGPLRGRLQAGEPVLTPAGRTVQPDEVVGPPRRGRHLAFVTDTAPCPAIAALLLGVDLAFVEGMFLARHQEEADAKRHLTAEQAAQAAMLAGARELRLVHVSPRYDQEEAGLLEVEARRHHPGARLAREGEQIEVPLPD